jgi:hypothetical protein
MHWAAEFLWIAKATHQKYIKIASSENSLFFDNTAGFFCPHIGFSDPLSTQTDHGKFALLFDVS